MDFALLPPEVNSGRMYAGAGAGPLLSAASSWDALGTELHTAGMAYESVLTELGSGWAGPSAQAMAAAAAPYAQWMRTAAVQAEETAIAARAATTAYETAFAMTVPPPVIAANRSLLMSLVATNFLGQNTPAIAATEAQYYQMWAQDAAAMYGYAAGAATASRLDPFTPAPHTTNPAGTANQAAAITQAAGHTADGQGEGVLTAITQALENFSLQTATGSSMFAEAIGADAIVISEPAMELGIASAELAIDSMGTFGIDALGTFLIDAMGAAEVGQSLLQAAMAGALPMTASFASATSLSGLSVPLAWATAAPVMAGQAGVSLVSAGAVSVTSAASVTPAVAVGETAVPAAGMAAAGLAGRATAGVGRGRRGPIAGTIAPPSKARPDKPAERPVASAFGLLMGADVELRELAELRNAGILTDEEYAAEKRSLFGR